MSSSTKILSKSLNQQRRVEILALYRNCLRSARRIPDESQRAVYIEYTQSGFRQPREATEAKRAIRDAKEQLERMNYYHTIREQKEFQEQLQKQQIDDEVVQTASSNVVEDSVGASQVKEKSSNRSQAEIVVEDWLLEALPDLKQHSPEDLKLYVDELLRDGFDSPSLLQQELTVEDLIFVKKAHKRALVRHYNIGD